MSALFWELVNFKSSSSNRVFGMRISSGNFRKASSSDAFLRSMRQLLSLTIMLIRLVRTFQTGLDLGHRELQKLSRLAQ